MTSAQGLLFGSEVAVEYQQPLYPASRVTLSSDSNDWCTPPEVLDPVHRFASIAFDPFSNPYSLVGAARSVKPPENSLVMDWPHDGLIYINPPFGNELAAVAEKIAAEARRQREIITLVPVRSDTQWWNVLSPPVWCAWRGRITFLETVEALLARHAERVEKALASGQRPPKAPTFKRVGEHLARGETATFAAALCYHGADSKRFAAMFAEYGKIYWEKPQ